MIILMISNNIVASSSNNITTEIFTHLILLKIPLSFLINNLPVWLTLSLTSFLALAILYLLIVNKKLRNSNRRENIDLRKSEERFKKLTNLTFEGIVIHRNGIFTDCNESFLKLLGYRREELIDQNVITKLIHPEDQKIVFDKVREQSTSPYEVRGLRKNGEIFPVEIESRDVQIDNESVRVAAIRDLSESKKQKELIEKEQWLLSTLMQNIPDSIYFKDLDSKFIRVNKSTIRKFNIESAEELIGKSDFDIFDQEHALPAFNDEQEIIKSGIPIINKIEKESWKDGKVGWVSTTKLPLLDSAGKIIGTFGLTRDITDLKNAQDNLIAQKEKFEHFLSLVPSAVFTVDLNQRITSWNSMAEEITGYKAEEVINQICVTCAFEPCENSCGLFDRNTVKPLINVEYVIKRKDGKEITISKNVDYIKDSSGEIIGGIESFIDVSQRKEYEDKITKINNELAESNKSKDRFFSIIAHDLRNPFITLLGFSEMLIEDYNDFTDEEKISYLKEMEKSAKSSYQLLENLLQWSRSQTGTINYTPQELNFKDILKENFNLLEKSAEMKNIKMISKLAFDEFVMADYDMLTTVIRNLLTNALKFTPYGGTITVGSSAQNQMIEFFIEDSGVGISPERIESVFRIDKTSSTVGTDGEKGSGLGLVLSKEFVEKHGGKIWIKSVLGKGTTFFLTLPKSKL